MPVVEDVEAAGTLVVVATGAAVVTGGLVVEGTAAVVVVVGAPGVTTSGVPVRPGSATPAAAPSPS